jgi:hypothetical protein
MAESKNALVAVYLSFKTFQSAIANLRAHGLPNRLDRSAWASRSGMEQGQIYSAFKFLGLIDKLGNTQESLKKLVAVQENSNEEKAILKEILKQRYQKVFALNLETVTPMQFAEAIGSYNAGGSTRDRAIRFFIKAAAHVGIPLSKRLGKGPATTTTKRHKPKSNLGDQSSAAVTKGDGDSAGAQQIKTITLPEVGGSLTVSGTFNAFELTGNERQLVYEIIDKMIEFEKRMTDE